MIPFVEDSETLKSLQVTTKILQNAAGTEKWKRELEDWNLLGQLHLKLDVKFVAANIEICCCPGL